MVVQKPGDTQFIRTNSESEAVWPVVASVKATPVVVLGSDEHWGLGILRSLGRLDIPVYTASSNPQAPAFSSRYCIGKIALSETGKFTEQSLQHLLSVGRQIGRKSILIPTSDQGVIFVADHADELAKWYTFPKQEAELIRSLCSKKEMYYLAKKFNIPTAEAVFPQSKRDVLDFLETASFPIMLKAIHGWRLAKLRRGQVNVVVNTRSELLEEYYAMEDPEEPNLMLQEYIPGDDQAVWMFNGYFNESSDCLAAFTGRKIRQWPAHRGITTLGICMSNKTVEETTREFMKAIGYRGIVDIGYRYDARDGRYKLLDINPRIGCTFRLFVADNGVDVVRALYLDMTGQPVTAASAPNGRRWLVEDLDLLSSLVYHINGSLSLKEWIRSYRGVREAAYFAFDDPLPLLKSAVFDIGQVSGKFAEQFARFHQE